MPPNVRGCVAPSTLQQTSPTRRYSTKLLSQADESACLIHQYRAFSQHSSEACKLAYIYARLTAAYNTLLVNSHLLLNNLSRAYLSSMASDGLRSPNAIPPRTSSTGQNGLSHVPIKPILKPVPEGDWISQRKSSLNSPTSMNPAMQSASAPAPSRHYKTDMAFHGKSTWNEDKEKILMGPYEYLFAQPGKDIRTQLIAAFNEWLEVPPKSLEIITEVVGMLHTASLLVDDVEDSSLLRRGLPVAHNIFGTAQTLNSANYVYFCALQELQTLKNPKAITIFTEELINLHRGQGMDLFWRETLTCPSEDDYLEMVGNKTGGLFRLAVKLMQAESKSLKFVYLSSDPGCPIDVANRDCVPLVNLIGIIFQIRDDYQNLSSPEYSHNKGLCEDLTEGKFSFPIIHSIRAEPGNLQLLNILKQKPYDEQVKRYAVAYMEGTGSFDYCRKVLATLTERARTLTEELDEDGKKGKGVLRILDKMSIQ